MGKLLTMDNLRRWGYVVVGWCCLCKASGELVDHLFLHCPMAVCLWNFVLWSFGVQWVISTGLKEFLFSWRNWLV